MTECTAMKRPGKPDTGNPFVRFDEGRGGGKETDNYGRFNSSKPLRLLYRGIDLMWRARGRRKHGLRGHVPALAAG